jgi:2-polyprenyl-6-methoxyphenol hydroxylase-like FAD-dependent oxidoreductase
LATHASLETNRLVLVVGAGPVGLGVAIELGRRGLEVLLVDERDGSVQVPKMSQVSTRTFEICRRWGLDGRLLDAGWPRGHPMDFLYVTSMVGYEYYRQRWPSLAELPNEPYSPVRNYQCPQLFFDPVLRDHAATLASVTMRYRTRLETLEQDAGSVRATLRDVKSGEVTIVRARYLVGCDGGQSTVREQTGIGMDGHGRLDFSVSIFFRSAHLAKLHDKGWARFYRVTDASGRWGDLQSIDGADLWRLTVLTGLDPALNLADFDTHGYIRRAIGAPCDYEIISVQPWERRELIADRYRQGRVFIAGDAAHQNSPTGGLGLNTGMGDAADIGWKLAAVIGGWGGEALLDSYEVERRPVAVNNARESSRLFRETIGLPSGPEVEADTPEGAALRRRLGELLEDQARSGKSSISERFRLGYCYEGSPVVIDDGTRPPEYAGPGFVQSAVPGMRAPHAWIGEGRSTLDLFGDGFVLLRLGAAPPDARPLLAAMAGRRVPFRVEALESAAIAALYERPLVLVRPDGHVVWRGNACPEDALSLVDRVRGTLPRAGINLESTERGGP